MKQEPKSGDKVSWKSHGGEAHGKVVKKQTSPSRIKGHKVAASKDDPQFIVEMLVGDHVLAQGEGASKKAAERAAASAALAKEDDGS